MRTCNRCEQSLEYKNKGETQIIIGMSMNVGFTGDSEEMKEEFYKRNDLLKEGEVIEICYNCMKKMMLGK